MEKVKEQLLSIPPEMGEAERLLQMRERTQRELLQIALSFINECRLEDGIVHAPYLYQVMELLLRHGLDLKEKQDAQELLSALLFVDHGHTAADTLGLLFEHGADPNGDMPNQSHPWEELDFDVWFGAVELKNRQMYDVWLHKWMVFIGYGATEPDGKPPVEAFPEYGSDELFDLRKLRQHGNYYCGLSFEDKEICVHIYDKETLWEVARR